MIFPKNKLLKITMYVTSSLGVWPFIFEDNPVFRKIYDIFSKITFCYYILFITTAFIQLFIILTDEVLDITEIVANLTVTLLNSITVLRVKAIKTERVKNMIQKVFKLENDLMSTRDEKMIAIYDSHVHQNHFYSKIYLINIYFVDFLYFIHPLYVEDVIKHNTKKNETVVIKATPLSSWFPFDQQKYHVLTYLWQQTDVFMNTTFISCSDIFALSLIIFGLSQIKILKFVLTNFQEYTAKVKNRLGCSQEEASFVTLRECILKHQEIIEFINEYNSVMRNIMVLDFLLSSMQLASIALTLLMTELTLFNALYSGEFAVSMFLRLLMYYWYANEIMVHGTEIGSALCSSNWYKESERVQKMMIMMLMRSNREIFLEIGSFTTMTLRTFLGILKATYSYMTLLYK